MRQCDVTLEELYPPGTKLSEVPPDFRGMPLSKWRGAQTMELFAAFRTHR